MTNHNDQERDLFEAWFAREIEPSVSYGNPDILRRSYWTAWQARAQLPKAGGAVPEGLLFAKETVVELPDGSKELDYTPMPDLGIFTSSDEVFDVIRELQLPLGWVVVRFGQVISGAAPHPVSGEQKPMFDTDWLIGMIDSGEWKLTRFQYDPCLTHEANTRCPWQIERQSPPFCDRQDVSFWRGKTPEHALMAAICALFPRTAKNMGIPPTTCALATHRAQLRGGDK